MNSVPYIKQTPARINKMEKQHNIRKMNNISKLKKWRVNNAIASTIKIVSEREEKKRRTSETKKKLNKINKNSGKNHP